MNSVRSFIKEGLLEFLSQFTRLALETCKTSLRMKKLGLEFLFAILTAFSRFLEGYNWQNKILSSLLKRIKFHLDLFAEEKRD